MNILDTLDIPGEDSVMDGVLYFVGDIPDSYGQWAISPEMLFSDTEVSDIEWGQIVENMGRMEDEFRDRVKSQLARDEARAIHPN